MKLKLVYLYKTLTKWMIHNIKHYKISIEVFKSQAYNLPPKTDIYMKHETKEIQHI